MKFKCLMILLLSLAGAASETQLECGASDPTQLTIGRNKSYLMHNYSFAEITCPPHLKHILRYSGKIRCTGTWQADFVNGQAVNNTPAWVEITKAGQKITAVTQTNYFYNRKFIKMNCVINR